MILNSLDYNLVTSVLADHQADADHAALNEVDFKTDPEKVRIQVNSWVEEEQTKGLVPEILPPGSVHSATGLIFANALYFKATWDDDYFYKPPKSKDIKDCALEDFDNGTYKYDATDGLPSLGERICSESGFLDRHLIYRSFTSVRVKKFLIPKFKISSRFEASGVLKNRDWGWL
ncbi:hypothetical protein ACLB2K_013604 [Fragaria x ananassa]